MIYRDKQGRFLSKKEFIRRKRISISLKKYWKEKNGKTSKAKRTNSRKRSPKQTIKRDYGRKYFEENKRTKIKAFPNKHQKENFFFSDKKKYTLVRSINFMKEPEKKMQQVKDFYNHLRSKWIKVALDSIKKSKKRKPRLMNIGYDITLGFKSLRDETEPIKKFRTISFQGALKISDLKSKKEMDIKFYDNFRIIIENIENRFVDSKKNSYISNNHLCIFLFHGFEFEIEAV